MTEPPTIPDFVLDDLDNNPGLVRRWIEDPEFRRGLLTDSMRFASENGFQLQESTAEWIQQRGKARGFDRLVGDEYPHIVAF
jgi:hypothetical protein